MGKLISGAIGLVKDFFQHWKHPKEGNYVSNGEIIAYSVGGMGVNFQAACFNLVTLNVNCTLVGFVYNIKPSDIALLLLINTIFTIVIQPLKSWLIDNISSSKGKARPYLLWLGPPSAILISLTAFIPMGWDYYARVFTLGGLYLIMNFVYQFYYGMYGTLAQLISPNTNERAKVVSFSSIIYSMAPTITGALFPALSLLFDKQLLDINFYRLVFPIFSVLGCAIGFIAYFFTKERIVLPRLKEKQKVKFIDGMKKMVRNRYFWINNITVWFQFGRGALSGFMTYAYICMLQNNAIMSPLTLVAGTCAFIGMVCGPIMMQKLGKRNTQLLSSAIAIVAAVPLIFFNNNFWLFFILMYVANWASSVWIITAPAFSADALDYQQWKTGDRMEGFSQNFTIISSLIAIGTNYVIPAITEYFGLRDNYDVLFDPAIRSSIFSALAVLVVVCTLGSALPYLFWDLNEKKHAQIIEDLKARAHHINEENGFADASILTSNEILDEDLPHTEVAAASADNADAEPAATTETPSEGGSDND